MPEVTRAAMIDALREYRDVVEAQLERDFLGGVPRDRRPAMSHQLACLRAALRELEAGGRVIEAAIRWCDDTAYEPPPVDDRQGWMQATWDRRTAAIDGLKAAIAEYESAPPGTSDGSDK